MSKRFPGVRTIEEGRVYEINYQRNHKRRQYRVTATSQQEAYDIKTKDMAGNLTEQPIECIDKKSSIEEAWRFLSDDINSDGLHKKTFQRYKKVFWRIYEDLRKREFPNLQYVYQISIQMIKRYKHYYVIILNHPNGWRSELTYVKAMIKKLYRLGLCTGEFINQLKEEKKPRRRKKDYPNIADFKIKKLLDFIKRDRIDMYRILYFLCRTGRRIEETTKISRQDVEWHGIKPVKINPKPDTIKQRKALPINKLDNEIEKVIRDANSESKQRKHLELFLNRQGRKCQQSRVREYLKEKSKEVIQETITPHYFRHRFLTKCAGNGVSVIDAMSIAGITDIKVVLEYYTHDTPEGLEKVLEVTRLRC